MGLDEKIAAIQKELSGLLIERRFEQAAGLILSHVDETVALTDPFIPPKALAVLKSKFRCGWGGSYTYDSEEIGRRMSAYEKNIFGAERELLEASHPRKVARLWPGLKPELEKRYGRAFESREDVAIMNGFYWQRMSLGSAAESLRNSLEKVKAFNAMAEEFPEDAWSDVAALWRDSRLGFLVHKAGPVLISLMKEAARPEGFLKEEHQIRDENLEKYTKIERPITNLAHPRSATVILPHDWEFQWYNSFSSGALEYLSTFLIEGVAGTLSFRKAIDLLNPHYAKRAEMTVPHDYIEWRSDLPDSVVAASRNAMARAYKNRQPGDDCSRFMDWFAKTILERWNLTAVDYDRIMYFHRPNDTDKKLMALFYTIRDCSEPKKDDERVHVGRLPELLRAMIADGILKADDVNPPLKDRYPGPDEVLTAEGRLIPVVGNLETALNLPEMRGDGFESAGDGNMLPALAGHLKSASVALDPTKEYYVVYSGDRFLFISTRQHFPNGELSLGRIYRFAKQKGETTPMQGTAIRISDRNMLATNFAPYELRELMRDAHSDANSDLIVPGIFTVITNMSPQDFRREYFRDFIAHALLTQSFAGANDVWQRLNLIDEMETLGLRIRLGITGRTELRTFELGGRFCFDLKHSKGIDSTEIYFLAYALTDYLKEVGVRMHCENTLDEQARAEIMRKTEERRFQNEHIAEVLDALDGNGLVNVLSFVLLDRTSYSTKCLGAKKDPCEHCGRSFVDGNIYRPGKEQWCEGFDARDLHDLAHHPETFRNRFGSFRRIYDAVTAARETRHTPIFIAHPEIMPEFNRFAEAYYEHVCAESDDFDLWMSNSGGSGRFEDEEIEETPQLQELRAEEIAAAAKVSETWKRMDSAAILLQRRYESITGTAQQISDHDCLAHFWADQVMLFSLYQAAAPKMLTAVAGQDALEHRIRLRTM